MKLESGKLMVMQEMQVIAEPAANIDLYEARDKWLTQDGNKVLDDGGRSDPRLLVAHDRSRTVLYELVPELTNNCTLKDGMAHMRNLGMDVRGRGPDSPDGYPTIIVSEKY